jgi:hypothetical protein
MIERLICINEHNNFKSICFQFLRKVFQVNHCLFVGVYLNSCSLIGILCSVLLLECRCITCIAIVTNSIDCNERTAVAPPALPQSFDLSADIFLYCSSWCLAHPKILLGPLAGPCVFVLVENCSPDQIVDCNGGCSGQFMHCTASREDG